MDKYNYDKHFLDSNILIGFVLRWDHLHDDCFDYFDIEWDKHTSERVYNESKGKITKYRKIQLDFLDKIYQESQYNNKLLFNFQNELGYFINRFIKKNKNNYFELPKKKFIDCILKFTRECNAEIYQTISDYSGYHEIFLNDIRTSFNDAIDELDNICYIFKDVETHEELFGEYESKYPGYEGNLKKLGIHNPDHRILLDCYYFKLNKFKKETAFITKDGIILKNNDKIEKLLDGIFVRSI